MQGFNPFSYLNHLFLLISHCKTVWQLPQNVRRSSKGWSSGAESLSCVPQESSWRLVPPDMNHLTPSVPVGCHTPRRFVPLISEQPPAGSSCHCRLHLLAFLLPLFGSEFYICRGSLVHFDQTWHCHEQKPVPTISRYPYFAPFSLCIHKDPRRFHRNCQTPRWNGAPSMSPTWCTAPAAPSWDRTIPSAVSVPPEPPEPSLVISQIQAGTTQWPAGHPQPCKFVPAPPLLEMGSDKLHFKKKYFLMLYLL